MDRPWPSNSRLWAASGASGAPCWLAGAGLSTLGRCHLHAYFWEQYLKGLDVVQAARAIAGVKDKEEAADGETASSARVDIFSDRYPFMKRLTGLSLTLTKVIVNIKKFPFNEKMYIKYVTEFGKRQLSKKMKYLEEI